ncbi:MAG: lysophospholipid acyltransferase family protein [Acidimicrobiia bacterium]
MRWPLIVVRSIFAWAVGVLATIVGATSLIVIALINDTSPMIEKVIRTWARTWFVASGSRLEVRGSVNIDPDRSYVVVANHLSSLDIMTCFLAVPLPIRFLAKKELFKIPLFAHGMRAVGIIEVDRAARSKVHESVNRQAAKLIAKKRSLIIYPEGTRPRDGVMKPFKKGAFTIAIDNQLPVLPLSIHGTYEAWPPDQPWIFGGKVSAIVDPPIETEGMTSNDVEALRDKVRAMIASRVTEMGGRVGTA